MRRSRFLIAALGAAGLAVFLWPAFAAPVVLWSDSSVDIAWAREGRGIWSSVWDASHPAKPGYLLFLRFVLAAGGERGVVILQSLLLWASIAITAARLARRRGAGVGVACYLAAVLFLRVRDAASAVMSEALAAALLLPLAALALDPPVSRRGWGFAGGLAGALFLVRPNVGGLAMLLLLMALAAARIWRGLLPFAAGAIVVAAPLWVATTPPPRGDDSRGLSYSTMLASVDDYWSPGTDSPSRRSPADTARDLRSRALSNWSRTLSRRGPDARRQLLWRALHGLFGSEFYDARWSAGYAAADFSMRVLSPLGILAAFALLFAELFVPRGLEGTARAGPGLVLAGGAVVQNLLLGSNPRLVLPILPALILLAIAAGTRVLRSLRGRFVAAAVTVAGAGMFASIASPLGMEWGVAERSGIRINQPIPRGALPAHAPATLHVRIAAPLVPSPAGLRITDDRGAALYASDERGADRRPQISISLPRELLDRNRREAVALRIETTGAYDDFHYLMFPVVPWPWRRAASREGSRRISPATGIASGALDWWAHDGADSDQQ